MTSEPNGSGPESWQSYRKLVLHELERLEERMASDFRIHMENDERLAGEIKDALESLTDSVRAIEKDVAGLQVKAGLWGAVAGSIPAVAAIIFILIERVL